LQLLVTVRFITFSVITNIYDKKPKGPTLMELLTATGKLKKKFFIQLEKFDLCTTGDTAHIDTIFKFLPHTRQHGCIDVVEVVKKNFFSFPVAVNNFIKVGPLVFRRTL
jgi:hypothetical protein